MHLYLEPLNKQQKQAVESEHHATLILAGAGTGKTRVLTSKIAYLLQKEQVASNQIMAVTFTNKAANEMRNRVENIMQEKVHDIWLGTFHSICAKILRLHCNLAQLQRGFTILDYDDQIRVIKQIQSELSQNYKDINAKHIAYYISKWKDEAINYEQLTAQHRTNYYDAVTKDDPIFVIYKIYEQRLKSVNAVDFGDLLLLVLKILQHNPDVLRIYHNQFKYILIDEYQDTNTIQYLWLKILTQGNAHIFCVGDEDQSIYGWRGAKVHNILRFNKDYPDAKIIRLEQNYRSSENILGAANSLINHNNERLGKILWTENKSGEKIKIFSLIDNLDEARFIAKKLNNLQKDGNNLNTMAILVRAFHQTRAFEEQFINLGIPYKILGGLRFYERKEIKDAIAYLRICYSLNDSLAFERIINTPKRGVGNTSLQMIHKQAQSASISLFTATQHLLAENKFKGKAKANLEILLKNILRWHEQSMGNLYDLAKLVLDESGYKIMLQEDKSEKAQDRIANLKEFVDALQEFESLESFLEHVSLVMDKAKESEEEHITLMTMHGAKGLEFDTILLPGWEEGLFPNQRSLDERNIEEERRLAYVAITRAKKRVIITYVKNRFMHGNWGYCMRSRFIDEISTQYTIYH